MISYSIAFFLLNQFRYSAGAAGAAPRRGRGLEGWPGPRPRRGRGQNILPGRRPRRGRGRTTWPGRTAPPGQTPGPGGRWLKVIFEVLARKTTQNQPIQIVGTHTCRQSFVSK